MSDRKKVISVERFLKEKFGDSSILSDPAHPRFKDALKKVMPPMDKGEDLVNGINGYADDDTYGHTPEKPVRLGGGPGNQRLFLSMLTGPNGEELSCTRFGSFKCKTGRRNLKDGYVISWGPANAKTLLFFDMYTYECPKAPTGLRIKPGYDRTHT